MDGWLAANTGRYATEKHAENVDLATNMGPLMRRDTTVDMPAPSIFQRPENISFIKRHLELSQKRDILLPERPLSVMLFLIQNVFHDLVKL
uniref:hypothetical protein n=1 Tax=Tellurirhabdus rosea TaxID=2674997 RepID=UPI002B1CBD63|nr:hypothetical protein [Tellurirhabdus rosea]